MEPDELAAGFASHWNDYEKSKKKGELCQFAIGSFLGGMLKCVYIVYSKNIIILDVINYYLYL